jgi:protein O-GlcNAc transferase
MATLAHTFDQALRHHQSGNFQQAEELYRQILQADPRHVEAWHLLGLIAGRFSRNDLACEYIGQALRLQPNYHVAHNSLGTVLQNLGRLEEAAASYCEALRLKPDFAEAHYNLGKVLKDQGKLEEAAASYRQALRLHPENFEAHNNLGNILQAQGKLAEAATCYQNTLRLKPDHGVTHYNLGNVFNDQSKLDEAIASYQEAIRLRPDLFQALNNLGNILRNQGKLAEAIPNFLRALHLRPDFFEAHNNLGLALQEQGRLDEAIASYRQALRFNSDYAEAHNNLGNALKEQGQPDEAIDSFQEALRLRPDLSGAHNNLGNAFREQGRLDEALTAYRTALGLNPEAAHLHSNLVQTLNYHPGYDARMIQEECARWLQQHAAPFKDNLGPHANRPEPERRLRIGYVSPDFREHVDSFFTIPLLSNHDARQFQIFCYANVARPDALTERLRGYAEVWRSTVELTDPQLAELVRADQIDILVDLKMHTANNRLLMFARKPAPVQVAWLAYPGTTGLSAIDYRLTDPYLDPPGLFDAFYAEESVRLPDSFWCYDPLTDQPPVNALPAAQNGYVTIGCLNYFSKLNDDLLTLWAQVLRAVPASRLLLLAPRGQAREHVKAKLQQGGIDAAHIEFADMRARPEYLRLYNRIDFCLDPVPCNGHTTSLDAFWMGVPTITLVSTKSAMGRAGWSQLCNLGLKELAADTPEQYVALAAELAADLHRLQELRGTLRQRMLRSPLMDGTAFARHVEHAYRHMWQRWCRT